MDDSTLTRNEFTQLSRDYAFSVFNRLVEIDQVDVDSPEAIKLWATLARSAQKYVFSRYAVQAAASNSAEASQAGRLA